MNKLTFLLSLLCMSAMALAQKKPLTHQSYDSWQSPGPRIISADGKYIAYAVNLQEGDGWLEISSADQQWKKTIFRGSLPAFSDDGKFMVCRIKPFYKDNREAKIKKKSPAEMPKDTLAIVWLGMDSVRKIPGVKSFRMPEKGKDSWLAWLYEKPAPLPAIVPDSSTRLQKLLLEADSLAKLADSLRYKVELAKKSGLATLKPAKTPAKKADEKDNEGTDLVLVHLGTGVESKYTGVTDYAFNKNSNVLVLEGKNAVLWRDLKKQQADTVMKQFNEVKGLTLADNGSRLVFYAERDSSSKSLHKCFKLWQYVPGTDTATILLKDLPAYGKGKMVLQSETNPWFSENNQRVFVGITPEWPVKDTGLVEFETAKLDLWSYTDDYLQPQQLVNLNVDKNRSWLTYIDPSSGKMQTLGNDSCEMVEVPGKGNSDYALGSSTRGYRIQQQWTMNGMRDLYLISMKDGSRRTIAKQVKGNSQEISPQGKYVIWYDSKGRHWKLYEVASAQTRILTKGITVPLYDELDDHPDDPPPHGFMGWQENDTFAFIYDRYDIWKCDLSGTRPPVCLTAGEGRARNITIRNNILDREKEFISEGQQLLFDLFDNRQKGANWMGYTLGRPFRLEHVTDSLQPAIYSSALKARDAGIFVYQQQTAGTNDLFLGALNNPRHGNFPVRLSQLNPQQAAYNWYSVQLFQWKALDGRKSDGILYTPEDFDPKKKYPVILYFYEKDADRLNAYIEPMPVRASINIAYYVSNGYLVFDPDITYKTGQPGEDAYNAVVGAAKFLKKFAFVDSTKMGIQGHSWGGYQVAYLVTRTNMFAAAEAGAPVSNMTSAYGGIRWGTGISRQFQYEKTQSRLGATLWEKPELYLKNSPLFKADKINTPLLILHNDKDDAVPWYQGIELFTALKRLGKKTWLVDYNDELHGIIERRNRKDWSIRMAQFFDHYLKGKPAPRWMTDGIPARDKGVDWGF